MVGRASCAAQHRRSAPLRPPRGDCQHPVPSSRWPHRMAARGTRVRLRQQRRQGWGRGRARRWPAGSALRAPGAPAQGGRLHSDLSRSFWSCSWVCSSRFIHVSPDRCTRPLSGRRRAAAGGRHARRRHPPMAHGRPAAAQRPPCPLLTTSDALSSSPHATRPSTDARMVANRGTGQALRAAGLRAARQNREDQGRTGSAGLWSPTGRPPRGRRRLQVHPTGAACTRQPPTLATAEPSTASSCCRRSRGFLRHECSQARKKQTRV